MTVSSTDFKKVLTALFQRNGELQKNVFVIVDEVKIRLTVSFVGGMLNGLSMNQLKRQQLCLVCLLSACMEDLVL